MEKILQYSDDRISLRLDGGSLGFNAEGVFIPKAFPSVAIKTGLNEEPVLLKPFGEPAVASYTRIAYGAEVKQFDLTWNCGRDYTFTWYVGFSDGLPGLLLGGSFCNNSGEPVRLQEICLASTGDDSLSVEGNPEAWLLSSPCFSQRVGNLKEVLPSVNELILRRQKKFTGDHSILSRDPKCCDGHWRSYVDFLTLYTENGKKGLSIGATGKPEADIGFECYVGNGSIRMDILSRMSDILVEPGQTRRAQEIMIVADCYRKALTKIFQAAAETHGHRTHRKPLFGWCSWYDKPSVREEYVLPLADFVKSNRDRLPMDVIQVDEGYEISPGDWRCNSKFPGGFEKMVQTVKESGAVPGIWLAPLLVNDSLPLLQNQPGWFQRDALGKFFENMGLWDGKTYYLDPTHPEVQEFLRSIIRNARKEGFKYYKIDFNEVYGNARFIIPI